jgi:MFS family permease
MNMGISNTVLPLYVINDLGYSNAQSGLLGTSFTIASMMCRFIAGNFTDKYGRRFMMVVGAAIVGLALICLGFTASLTVLLIFKFFQGVGHSFNSTASNAGASDVLPHERLGEGIGYYGLNATISGAFGPSVALALMGVGTAASVGSSKPNYLLPLLVAGAIGLIAAGISLSLGKKSGLKPATREPKKRFEIGMFIERRALRPALLQAFQAVSSGASIFMIVFANEKGFKSIALYYIISAICTLVTRVVVGKRMDTVRPMYIVLLPLILIIASYFYLAFTLSEEAFIVNAVVLGVFNAMLVPTFNSLCLKLSPPTKAGAASATYWLGFDAGMAVGQIVFGAIIDAGGFFACFLIAGIYMVVFTLVAIFFLRPLPAIIQIVSPES